MTAAGFLGIIVAGRIVRDAERNGRFDVRTVLGSAFVCDPSLRMILTCEHVLPAHDWRSDEDFAFYTSTALNQFQVHALDRTFYERWNDKDLVALRLTTTQHELHTRPLHLGEISHGDHVVALGVPVDFQRSTPENTHVVPRAFTGFVVSVYSDDCEMDSQVIKTMSGGPVMYGNSGHVAGVAHSNRQYSRELLTEETIETVNASGGTRVERYTYNEVLKLGVFYKASSWGPWLESVKAQLRPTGNVASAPQGLGQPPID